MTPPLHILHLGLKATEDEKINRICDNRLFNLLKELHNQGIDDFKIIDGFYDLKNTKEAIHRGHNRIVEMAKNKKLPYCVIAEDDIVFSAPGAYKYFLSQIPKSYDVFCGLVYAGQVEDNRIMNSASGIMSLYVVHSRFYDFFLSLDTNTHIDREIGSSAHKHEYYVVNPYVVTQRGGFSINLGREMFYTDYLQGKKLFGQ